MVNKLLFSHQRFGFLMGAIIGSLTGIVLLLGSLQLYIDFDRLINGSSDINQPQYLVINKQVSVVNTLFGGQKGFSQEEINALKKIDGVMDVAPLTASRFKVAMSMGMEGMPGLPGMYTDLFFEAVPDEFTDVSREKWNWSETDSLIPIIVPRDYIKLYNFGFAPTQKLPQLTEDMIGMATFNIVITKGRDRITYKGRIVGFTERINTILAPKSFIDFANKEFAGIHQGQYAPNRVIIRCKGAATAQLVDYFGDNGYETSEESLRNSKMSSVLNLIMTVCVALGSVIIFLSLIIFLLYSQLIIARSSYEIQTLIFIGRSPRKLIMTYMKFYTMVFSILICTALLCVYLIKMWVGSVASEKGFPLRSGVDFSIGLIALGLFSFFLIFNYLSVRRNIVSLAKGR